MIEKSLDKNAEPELFVPADVIDAFIDSGYNTTDNAIAEILDNSIEADAKNVHIFIVRSRRKLNANRVWRISQIGVLDDGCGMDPQLLSRALTFGAGTHLRKTNTIGREAFGRMGKYGVGLPNSSISQSDETHVYSWLSHDAIYVSTLSLPKIRRDEIRGPTVAELTTLPKIWVSMMQANNISMPDTGTLVVWDDLQRATWETSKTTSARIQETVGRIYRKFITEGKVRITLSVFNDDDLYKPHEQMQDIRANDPMFLMDNSLAHGFIDNKKEKIEGSLFKTYVPQELEGKDHFLVPIQQPDGSFIEAKVGFKFSICDPILRRCYGGNAKIGQLADRNSGVSICRSGRELKLVKSWIKDTDPRNRWWGCEIDFPPALDEVFGVTNNKQGANKLENFGNEWPLADNFSKHFGNDWNDAHPDEASGAFTISDILDLLKRENDLSWVKIFILYVFENSKKKMREKIDRMKESSETGDDHDRSGNDSDSDQSPSDKASREKYPTGKGVNDILKERKDPVTDKAQQDELTKRALENDQYSSEAEKIDDIKNFKAWLESEEQVLFRVSDLHSSSFFDGFYDESSERIIVRLNSGHPAYTNIFEMISFLSEEEKVGDETLNDNKTKMVLLRKSLALLLFSWVTYERKDYMSDSQRKMLRHAREHWGEKLENLLEDLNEYHSNEGD